MLCSSFGIVELDGMFESIIKYLLDDFVQNTTNVLVDLLVDSLADVSLGIMDLLVVSLVVAIAAEAVFVEGKCVMWADKLAVACLNIVSVFIVKVSINILTRVEKLVIPATIILLSID